MSKVRVALDTSTLRRDPTFKGAMLEALARFAEEGYIDIIISSVVVNEFATLPSPKIEALTTRRKTLKELRKTTPDELYDQIVKFEDELGSAFAKLEDAAKTLLDAWISRTHATIEDVRPDHAARVLKRYFAGELPFATVKARQDFPDGFIYEIISSVAANGEVLVVASDTRLRKALEMVSNVTVFSSVRQILESDEFDDLRSEVETENVTRVVEALRTEAQMFDDAVEDGLVNRLAGTFVSYRDPQSDEKEPEEELYIELIGPVTAWQLGNNSDYLGEGVISIDFSATVEINVDTSTGNPFHDDLYQVPSERTVEVEGALSLQMDTAHLTTPSSDWSGTKIKAIAELNVDEVFSVELVETEY